MDSGRDDPTRNMADGTDPAAGRAPDPAEPAPLLVDRYVVLDKIGEGGMSHVYRAYDPRLERSLALKFLKPSRDPVASRRIIREARAMARLSHDNVLPVYDVCTEGPQPFIAMEYVRGQTLREWIDSGRRAASPIVAHYAAAARGLAAAHAEGFVHRDFKPSNVLLGDDGRIRVMDFGLVRTVGDHSSASTSTRSMVIGGVAVSPNAGVDTEHGSVMGTLPYMSPEQHRGQAVDARSDQYALCVALWESLVGACPFDATAAAELLLQKLEGPPVAPRSIPAWLAPVLLRGLSPDRSARHASLEVLATALEHGVQPRRRRTWAAATAAFAGLGGLGVGLSGSAAIEPLPCAAGPQRVAEFWNDGRRDAVSDALLGTHAAFAPRTTELVTEHLDAWSRAWVDGYRSACEATAVYGEASTDMLDLRMSCLQRRRGALEALTRVLLDDPDEDVVLRAADLAASLPSPAECNDATRLAADLAPPADRDAAARVAHARDQLEESRVRVVTGHADDGLALAQEALATATALDYDPLRAEAMLARSRALRDTGRRQDARNDLEQAHAAALRSRHDQAAAAIAIDFVEVYADFLESSDDAQQWAGQARAWAARSEAPPTEHVRLLLSVASADELRGDNSSALRGVADALAVARRDLGEAHPLIDVARNVMGITHSNLGEQAQARALFEQVRASRSARLGADHPAVAQADNNIGMTFIEEHDYAQARPFAERAVASAALALGEQHPEVAGYVVNMALVHAGLGDTAAEREQLLRALAIQETALGPDHLAVGRTLMNLGSHYASNGDPATARPYFARARDLLLGALGPDHAQVGLAEALIGHTDHDRDRLSDAQQHYERALAIYAQALPADHPWPVMLRHSLIGLLHEQGHAGQARAELAHQRTILSRSGTQTLELAEPRLELAKLVWEYFPDERASARTLAQDAHTLAVERAPELAAAAQTWLTAHPLGSGA